MSLLLALLLACGARPVTCDASATLSTCAYYPSRGAAETSCPALGGVVGAAPCPDAPVATCVVGPVRRVYYADGPLPWTPQLAMSHCRSVLGGTVKGPDAPTP